MAKMTKAEMEAFKKKNFNLKIKVTETQLDKLRKEGTPTKAIAKYKNDPAMREALNRFYGKARIDKAVKDSGGTTGSTGVVPRPGSTVTVKPTTPIKNNGGGTRGGPGSRIPKPPRGGPGSTTGRRDGSSRGSAPITIKPGNVKPTPPKFGPPVSNRPGPAPANRPGPRPADRPGPKPGNRPGPAPANRPGPKPADRPGPKPGNRPGPKPGNRPGNNKPKIKPTPKPTPSSTMKPNRIGPSIANRPGPSASNRPGPSAANRPGPKPSNRPSGWYKG
jgi:hypothetical protein